MIKKTKDYEMFKFRNDNREHIGQPHLKRIIESIKNKNLLEFRPIVVNETYEVLDGQHRLLAAKALKLDIYYQVHKDIKHEDIMIMNMSKAWTMGDYLNYYCKNGYIEYQKLEKFMKQNNIGINIALSISIGFNKMIVQSYKEGKYIFNEDLNEETIDKCWEITDTIKKFNGHSSYTKSSRFWNAMLKLVNHGSYDHKKFKDNLVKQVGKMGPRARQNDYYVMFMDVNNWHNKTRIDLLDE